jgi:hypothetical protein
LIARALKA